MKTAAFIGGTGAMMAFVSALLLQTKAQPTWMFATTLAVGAACFFWGIAEVICMADNWTPTQHMRKADFRKER